MCGLAGSFRLGAAAAGGGAADSEWVARAAAALAHRGPDRAGFAAGPGYAVGFRRLAILDLAPSGDQPQRYLHAVAACNGEIYNFRELRRDLEARGHTFRSTGDAELIPHLYVEHGLGFVERLEGMFAIALVDERAHRLVLVRDRLGKKPLYWRERGGSVEFASEAKAFRAADGGAAVAEPASLVHYLAFGAVPGARSAFAGMHRLPPATLLVAEAGRVETSVYWTPPLRGAGERLPRAEWKRLVFEALVEATRARLAADVPLGLFLSGGIDSGLVLAAAQRAGAGPVETFTIGFAERSHDERELAAATARTFGARHSVLEAEPAPERALGEIAAAFDEPFGDASAYPTLLVSRLARQRVAVALAGDGGDECFAGYRRHQAVRLAGVLGRALPRPLSALAARALGESANGSAGRTAFGELRRFAAALGLPESVRTLYWSTFFTAPLRARFLHPELQEAAAGADPEGAAAAELLARTGSPLALALHRDLVAYLPDDLLVKVDLASMSCGLEVRAPFLDRRMVELAARVPDQELCGPFATKRLLRALADDLLPRAVARGQKRGFGVPLAAWLRGPLEPLARDWLCGERFGSRRILRPGAAEELLARHRGGEDWSQYVWLLLALEAWFRRWIDGERGP